MSKDAQTIISVRVNDQELRQMTLEQLNARLQTGDVSAEDTAWMPGLPTWTAVRSLEGVVLPSEPVDASPANREFREVLSSTTHPWRRFFARFIDLILFSLLIGFLPISLASDSWLVLTLMDILTYLLWLPLEALCLAKWGTTPGKNIFGIRVMRRSGGNLPFRLALRRSLSVWVKGEALGISLLSIITNIMAYFRLTETGTTLWDAEVDAVVVHWKWGFLWGLICTLLVIMAYLLLAFIQYSAQM